MSKTIITVQHTESEHHLNGHAGAWGNWPLTKKGHQQAFEIGKWLLTEGCDDGYIMYCSDLTRAAQTFGTEQSPSVSRQSKAPMKKILVVSHGCTLSFLQAMLMKFRFEYEAFIKIYNLRFPEDLDMDEDYRFDISPVMI